MSVLPPLENFVDPTALVHPSVKMGKGNVIGPHCFIGPNVTIGDDNTFNGFVSVGMPAEHKDFFDHIGHIVIGHRNRIREFVTINSSTKGVTQMGDDCIMLRGSHLSHDSVLEDKVTVSCNVLIGGESTVMKGANLGLGSIIHQRQVIGSYSMLGMGSVVSKRLEVIPGMIFFGNPAKMQRKNEIGLHRAGITSAQLMTETDLFYLLRKKL